MASKLLDVIKGAITEIFEQTTVDGVEGEKSFVGGGTVVIFLLLFLLFCCKSRVKIKEIYEKSTKT